MVGESDQTAELGFAISKCRFGAIDPLDKTIDSTEQIRCFVHGNPSRWSRNIPCIHSILSAEYIGRTMVADPIVDDTTRTGRIEFHPPSRCAGERMEALGNFALDIIPA